MTDTRRTPTERWSMQQAMILTAACLMAGIAGGWLIREARGPASHEAAQLRSFATPAQQGKVPMAGTADPARLKAIADADAAPLLAKLEADPRNPDLLASLGNLYYDAQAWPVAIDYYGRSLQVRPSDAAVRTDLGTAYWYMGDAGSAIAAFNAALSYKPDNPNTLFNRGLVLWQGKMDGPAAIADWKRLLKTDPDYEGRAKVEQLIAEAEKQGPIPSQRKQTAGLRP